MYIDMNGYPHLENKADIEPTLGTSGVVMTKDNLQVIYSEHNTLKDISMFYSMLLFFFFLLLTHFYHASEHLLQQTTMHGFPVVLSANNYLICGYIRRLSLIKAILMNKRRINNNTEFAFMRHVDVHDDEENLPAHRVNRIDISDYLDPNPVQITEYTPIDRVYDLFKALGLRYCLVARNSKLVGIITKKDVVRFVRHETK